MDIRALDAQGRGKSSDLLKALDLAVKNNADTINNSWGSQQPTDGNDPLSRAADKTVEKGAITCCAAGNSGMFVGPPALGQKVLSVGALGKNFRKIASYSSWMEKTKEIILE